MQIGFESLSEEFRPSVQLSVHRAIDLLLAERDIYNPSELSFHPVDLTFKPRVLECMEADVHAAIVFREASQGHPLEKMSHADSVASLRTIVQDCIRADRRINPHFLTSKP